MAKTFVYTELQLSIPFAEYDWPARNAALRDVPGLVNKAWLAGAETHSVGGFYEFASIETATEFAVRTFPAAARRRGVAQTTRIFDGAVVEEASRAMNSVHFGTASTQDPGAFVYTEAQVSAPFDQAPWRSMNPVLLAQPGLLNKTWLSGVHTGSVGGFYAFDTLDNARRFVTDYFPTEAAALNVAYTTRLFDAAPTAEASRAMGAPHYRVRVPALA